MFNVRNLRVGGNDGCLMSGIYVLAVMLVVVLVDDVRNLRVGGNDGCLMSGIYVLAVVLAVVLVV